GGGPAEQLALRVDIGEPAAVIRPQVVADHRRQRHQHGRPRGEQHQHEQLVPQRGAQAPHDDLLATTLRATPSRRESTLTAERSDAGGATSKRTLLSTTTKLMMLPSARPCSDSVTVSTGSGLAAASQSGSWLSALRDTKRTCTPDTGSPRRSLRTT